MKRSLLKEIMVWIIVVIGLVIFTAFAYIIGSNKNSFLSSFVIYKTLLGESKGIYVGTKVTIHGKKHRKCCENSSSS